MTIKPRPITIDMEKVKALGLKPGPVIGVLKKGTFHEKNNFVTKKLKIHIISREIVLCTVFSYFNINKYF